MNLPQLAEQIVQALQLTNPPVALSFLDECPADVSMNGSAVPSSCAFWVRAGKELFFAPAAAHENCPAAGRQHSNASES